MGQKAWAGSRDDLCGEWEKKNDRGVAGETCVGLDTRVADNPTRRAATGPIANRADQDDHGDQKVHGYTLPAAQANRVLCG